MAMALTSVHSMGENTRRSRADKPGLLKIEVRDLVQERKILLKMISLNSSCNRDEVSVHNSKSYVELVMA